MFTLKPYSQKIQQLHWETDYQAIIYLLAGHVFPWNFQKALEFALFRTFAVPSISKLLDQTGEFRERTRKRYDDTELILAEMIENGLDSDNAKAAFRRMNKMHNSYNISNDDFLYVLTTFIYVPIDWINRYGWRPLTENEQMAIFKWNIEVGKRMNIKTIPNDFEEFRQFHHQYETTHFKPAASNTAVARPTVDLLLSFYLPKRWAKIGKPIATCLMDDLLRQAMGFPAPPPLLQKTVQSLMGMKKWLNAYAPERQTPYLRTKQKHPTYPKGYTIKTLGTFPK